MGLWERLFFMVVVLFAVAAAVVLITPLICDCSYCGVWACLRAGPSALTVSSFARA